jgi:hypothetical protein
MLDSDIASSANCDTDTCSTKSRGSLTPLPATATALPRALTSFTIRSFYSGPVRAETISYKVTTQTSQSSPSRVEIKGPSSKRLIFVLYCTFQIGHYFRVSARSRLPCLVMRSNVLGSLVVVKMPTSRAIAAAVRPKCHIPLPFYSPKQ